MKIPRRLLLGRRARAVRKAVAGVVVAVGALAAIELGVRVLAAERLAEAKAGPPEPTQWAPTMRGNPYLLWEYAPGLRTELAVPVTINSLGLRGPEPTLPKPTGVRRILATGDSSIYGFGVADGEVFLDVATRALGSGIEGWSAAIPGYSTWQSLNLLHMRALALQPDVLVIGNLWSDNNFDSFVDRDLLSVYAEHEDSRAGRLRSALSASAAFRLLDWELRVKRSPQAKARKVGWTVGGGTQVGLRRVEVNDYAANLDALVDVAVNAGAHPVFLMLPGQGDLDPGQEPAAWDLYRQVMQDTAERRGVPLIHGPALFRASGLTRDELFLDELHPSAQGHRILGVALAEILAPWAAGGLLPDPLPAGPRPTYTDNSVHGAPRTDLPPVHDEATPEAPRPPEPAPAAPLGPVVRGELLVRDSRGAVFQVDAVVGATARVVGRSRVLEPGPFEVELSEPAPVLGFIVFEDLDGDGPSQGDRRFDLPIGLDASESVEGVVLRLDHPTGR